MRTGVVLLAAVVVAGSAAAASPARYWSSAKALRMVDRMQIEVGSRTVRIRSATTLCSGEGRPIRHNGMRLWQRFLCTYSTFTKAGIDRDLDFRVRVLGVRRFAIRNAHWVS